MPWGARAAHRDLLDARQAARVDRPQHLQRVRIHLRSHAAWPDRTSTANACKTCHRTPMQRCMRTALLRGPPKLSGRKPGSIPRTLDPAPLTPPWREGGPGQGALPHLDRLGVDSGLIWHVVHAPLALLLLQQRMRVRPCSRRTWGGRHSQLACRSAQPQNSQALLPQSQRFLLQLLLYHRFLLQHLLYHNRAPLATSALLDHRTPEEFGEQQPCCQH
jgi:hypothetical protein